MFLYSTVTLGQIGGVFPCIRCPRGSCQHTLGQVGGCSPLSDVPETVVTIHLVK